MELIVNQIGIYLIWLSVLFTVIMLKKYGMLPAISTFYYVLEEEGKQVLFFLFLADISLAMQLVVDTSWWYIFCSIGLLGVAGMPQYKHKVLTYIHSIMATSGIICGFIGIGLDPNVQELSYYFKYMEWLPLVLFGISCLLVLIIKKIKLKVIVYEISAVLHSFISITAIYY